jgi:transcriptional regulator with XRE-family HTH domain
VKPTVANCLGQVIRELRIDAGLSQVVFAEKSGLFQTYLSRIENGKANPSLNALEVISKTLGVSIFDLFEMVRLKSQV